MECAGELNHGHTRPRPGRVWALSRVNRGAIRAVRGPHAPVSAPPVARDAPASSRLMAIKLSG